MSVGGQTAHRVLFRCRLAILSQLIVVPVTEVDACLPVGLASLSAEKVDEGICDDYRSNDVTHHSEAGHLVDC